MGDPAKDKAALAELNDISQTLVKRALDGCKSVHPQIKQAVARLTAAVHERNAEVIEFEGRSLQSLSERLGDALITVDDAIFFLQRFADDPNHAAAHDAALKLVRAVGKARQDLGQWVAKADKLQAHAADVMKAARQRSGDLEVEWAKARARIVAGQKVSAQAGEDMAALGGQVREALDTRDGPALDAARQKADKLNDSTFVSTLLPMARRELAAFEESLKTQHPSPEFLAQFKRERAQALAAFEEIQSAVDRFRRIYADIGLAKLQFDFRKVAEALGIPVPEAIKLGPALALGDSGKLKALEAVAKKHALSAPPKQLLASLQKRGLVARG